MGQLRSYQIENNTLTGASFRRELGIYDETESLSAGEIRYWKGGFWKTINSITGVKEGDLSQTPDISPDWILMSKKYKVVQINSDYGDTKDWEWDILEVDTSGGDITLTLPNDFTTNFEHGRKRFIFNTGNNIINLDLNGNYLDNTTGIVSISQEGYLEFTKIDGILKKIRGKGLFIKKNPDDVPYLELWLDASQITGNNGDTILTWNDLSGNNRNFSSSTGDSAPILLTDYLNHKNVLQFDGSNDVMSAGDEEVHDNTRGLTMFAVVNPHDSNRRCILGKYLTTNDNREFDFGNGTNYMFSSLTWTSRVYASVQLAINNFQIYEVVWRPGETYRIYQNGQLLATGDSNFNTVGDGIANLKVGCADYTGVGYWNGEIAEIIVYSNAVSDADRDALRSTLITKWNLNVNLPTPGIDSSAIHQDQANEINNIPEKTLLNENDIFIIEDSEDNFNKKKVSFNTILKGASISRIDASSGSAVISELNKIYYITAASTDTDITIPDADANNEESWIKIFKDDGNGRLKIHTTSYQLIDGDTYKYISYPDTGIEIKSSDSSEWVLLDNINSQYPIVVGAIGDYGDTRNWQFDVLEFSITANATATMPSDFTNIIQEGEKRFIFNPSAYQVFLKTNGNLIDGSQDTIIINPDGYVELEKIDNELKIIRSKNIYRGFSIVGNGADGDTTISSTVVINTYTALSGNELAGDSIITVLDATGFSVGDEIMLHQTQDAANNNAGVYEFKRISAISGNDITLDNPLENNYYSGTFGGLQNEITQVVRVPNYNNLTITTGGIITSTPWDSSNGYGGIVAFRVKDTLDFTGGKIDVSGQGFWGGKDNGGGNNAPGDPGESEIGFGWQNDSTTANCNPNGSGGGGGYGPSGYGGTAGGGGGHLTRGGDAVDGSSPPAIAQGGDSIGDIEMTRIHFGGAGGGGGDDDDLTTPGAYGGNSGGIVYIAATTINNAKVYANGQNGISAGGNYGGDGGGGAGGSIYIQALNFTKDEISANGGLGGSDSSGDVGGAGSAGIIKIPSPQNELIILELYKENPQPIANGVWTDITWENNDFLSNYFTLNGAEIIFNQKGTYKIEIDATGELISGTARSTIKWQLWLDDGSGYSLIKGAARGTYHRTDGNDITSMSINKIINAEAGYKIKLVAMANTNNLQTLANGCNLIVEKK